MDDFDPAKDRIKQARDADTLARLRAAAPGAADRLTAAAQAEPSPVAVHLAALRKNFPEMPFLHRPWGRAGLPDLRSLADLATLRKFFSRKQPVPPRVDNAQFRQGIAELTAYFSRR